MFSFSAVRSGGATTTTTTTTSIRDTFRGDEMNSSRGVFCRRGRCCRRLLGERAGKTARKSGRKSSAMTTNASSSSSSSSSSFSGRVGSEVDDDSAAEKMTRALLSKRDLMKRIAGASLMMTTASSGLILPGMVAFAGEEGSSSSSLPRVPRTETPLKFTEEYPSAVIKGCWQLSGGHKGDPADDRTSKDKGAVEDFETFVNAGITTFDTGPTACGYGDSELVIGDFLKRNRSNSEQCRVHTKLCCVGREQVAMTEKWVKENAFDIPSKRLGGLKKIDMVQMYWNEYGSSQYIDCALYLTDLKAKGLIGSVALTNFNTQKMEDMINKGAEISSNQIQYSLLDRRPDLKMNEFCKASGVKLLPYGVLAGGFLSNKFLEADVKDVVLDTGSKRKYSSVIRNFGGWGNLQKLLRVLDSIGKKHDQSIANVATRWVLEKESVLAVILGARNDFHVEDHQKLFQFTLDADDKSKIDEALSSTTKATGDCYDWERGGKW